MVAVVFLFMKIREAVSIREFLKKFTLHAPLLMSGKINVVQ